MENNIIYAKIEFKYNIELVLIPDPHKYDENDLIVYTCLDREVNTNFGDVLFDVLEDWKPYNGEFTVDTVFGHYDDFGEFVESHEDFDQFFYVIEKYKNGDLIEKKYEEG